MSTFLDITQSAKKLNISPQQVRSLCRFGRIQAQRIGNSWVIDERTMEKFIATNSYGEVADRINTQQTSKQPIALSFFSGAMGLDIGIEKAGFNVRLASEIDSACRKTIRKNHPDIGLIGDIRKYSDTQILAAAGLVKGQEIDLIIGGPPCQAFSTAGKRLGLEDERGNVFLRYIDLIHQLRPKYAVIENVRGLLSTPMKHIPHKDRTKKKEASLDTLPGGALFHILEQLENSGYKASFNLYNAANFGTPQKRERVVIICSRDGKRPPFLVPTHAENGLFGLSPWRTLRQAIEPIQKEQHDSIKFPERRLKYYKMLTEGQNWKNLPQKFQREALGASYDSGGGKTGFYRRLAWDKPSPTLVTHPAMPATDLAHPILDRPLSVQEYKRIQEFPDNWEIQGTLIEQYKQIGNAVPIKLGTAIGSLILGLLNNEEVPHFPNFPYSRYKGTDDITWKQNMERKIKALKS